MKISIGKLRRLIAEAALDQMKLGVASAFPPASHFDTVESEDDADDLTFDEETVEELEPWEYELEDPLAADQISGVRRRA